MLRTCPTPTSAWRSWRTATALTSPTRCGRPDADQASLARAGLARLDDGVDVPVCSAEDTLLAKLTWFRRGGEVSERQWTDVLGLLRVATMDTPYLLSAAEARGVADLLARAIVAAGLLRR